MSFDLSATNFIVRICACNLSFLDELFPTPAHLLHPRNAIFNNSKNEYDIEKEAAHNVRHGPHAFLCNTFCILVHIFGASEAAVVVVVVSV